MQPILNKLKKLEKREKLERHIEYKETRDQVGKHLVKTKKEKDYCYYSCDNCSEKVKIGEKWENRNGGVIDLPQTVTGLNLKLRVVLCNECFKKLEKEIN